MIRRPPRSTQSRSSAASDVYKRQVDTRFAEPREGAQIRQPAVQRQLVHLEVAGVQHGPGTGPDRHRERVGDRVVDRDELALELTEALDLTLLDLKRDRSDPVLDEFRGYERQGEA